MFKKSTFLAFVLSSSTTVIAMERAIQLTVNNKPINVQQNSVICFESDAEDLVVGFTFNDGALSIGRAPVTKPSVPRSQFTQLFQQKEKMKSFILRDNSRLTVGKALDFSGTIIDTDSQFKISVDEYIKLENSVVDAASIVLGAPRLEFTSVFIIAPILIIESNSPKSLIKAINIEFNENSLLPHMIKGSINFEINEIPKHFLVVGAKTIEIEFRK